ncbi:MAG TPA: ATP-binding protein [Anaerolineae bacterium]|nr:ATP-binding protein [Anaerolineae bacterium]
MRWLSRQLCAAVRALAVVFLVACAAPPEFDAAYTRVTPARLTPGDAIPQGQQLLLSLGLASLLFIALVAIAAVGIHRFMRERQRAEKVRAATYRISEAALSTPSLDALFRAIHDIVGELMPAQNFYTALYDPATDRITFSYAVDQVETEPWTPKKSDKGLIEYVLRTGKPLLASPDVFEALAQAGEVELVGAHPIDWLGVPLNIQDRTIGVLAVQTYTGDVRYHEEDRDILMFVATQVAMAIERKRAEEALRASETKLRYLVEQLPSIIYVDDATREPGITLYVSPQIETLLGIPPAEWLAADMSLWSEHIHPDDRKRVVAEYLRCFTNREPFVCVYRMITRQGEIKWFHDEAIPLPAEADQPCLVQGVMFDITDVKRAEEELHRYAQRLEEMHAIDRAILAAQSPVDIARAAVLRLRHLTGCERAGVALFDFENQTARSIVVEADQPAGPPEGAVFPLEALPPLDELRRETYQPDLTALAKRAPIFDDLLAAGMRSTISVPLIIEGQLTGHLFLTATRPAAFDAAAMEMAREVAVQLAVALQEAQLREELQRHAEELEQRVAERTRELAEANTRLTELDRLKSKFVSDVSHELRTPIMNLTMHLDLLERGKPDKHEHYIAVLKAQAARLGRLVESILDLSRLEQGAAHPAFESLNFNALVEQVIGAQRLRAEALGLALIFEPCAHTPAVRGVFDQLAQVVTNLVSNAISYTPSGEVRVSTCCDVERGPVCLQVEDSGIGIDPEDLPYLFDRFYRGRRAAHSDIPGSGLGLAIVKEIVESHDGQIEVESQVGRGSRFLVWLPKEDAKL